MNLVYVTSGFPYPLTSGYLRHYHLLARLAQEHEIRLFSLVGRDHTDADRSAIEQLGVDVTTFAVRSTRWRRYGAQAARLAPMLVTGAAADLRRAVRTCVDSGWPDAAVVSGKTTSGVLSTLRDVPLLVDACDATSMRLESQMSDRGRAERVLAELELRAMRWVERTMLRQADHVVVASRRDGEHLGWSDRMSVVPNGVDTDYWHRRSTQRPVDTVIFTGKMSYAPNEDAALRIIDEVWPIVRGRHPDAQLMIVGTSPGQRLVDAGSRDGVTVTGRVDDMRDYLDAATVFAAPIRYGAGIQNKLLEALSMQVPVVASSNATNGLMLDGDEPPVRSTDDLTTMAELIIGELDAARSDPAAPEALRTWVAERFDWDRSASRVDAILHQLSSDDRAERTS